MLACMHFGSHCIHSENSRFGISTWNFIYLLNTVCAILTVYRQRDDKFLRSRNVAGYACVVTAVGRRHLVYDQGRREFVY